MEPLRIANPHDLAADKGVQKTAIEDLTSQHRDIFTRAVANVLSSEIAQITYAQIADGLPLSSVEMDTYGYGALSGDHPLHTKHTSLCPGALEKAQELHAEFNPNSLQLLYEYQAASPGSRAFQTRLIELIAVAIHQMAVWIVKLDVSLHKDDGIATWEPPKDDATFWIRNPNGPPPTLFQHTFYRDYDQYPEGVADGVGYWAEARILGGVVLFDRRDAKFNPSVELKTLPRIDPNAVYFHADRQGTTYRIYQLLDSQKEQLLDYLLSEKTPPAFCPLPILATNDNRRRVDPEEHITDTGIYRDIWERKPPPWGELDFRIKDVMDELDYPTMDDWDASHRRGYEKKEEMYSRFDEDPDREQQK
ncbi:hypothetical protein V502_01001 [Pseudogymnoascus sp. VKM F-4520 (FW-2644)]|nr:hypothetical protein V502_01001 [Pseudogymnoascus sp. VKM F-4520 (FW-2644)]